MLEIGRTGPSRHGSGFPGLVPAPNPHEIAEDRNMPDEKADLWTLYRHMLRSRLFEEAVRVLWEAGDITGEIHSGLGEEAVAGCRGTGDRFARTAMNSARPAHPSANSLSGTLFMRAMQKSSARRKGEYSSGSAAAASRRNFKHLVMGVTSFPE